MATFVAVSIFLVAVAVVMVGLARAAAMGDGHRPNRRHDAPLPRCSAREGSRRCVLPVGHVGSHEMP